MSDPAPPSRGITRFIPGLALFKGVKPALLRSEFIVAITVFAVLVPSAMAFGDLAGVTPVAGLYVALGALVMYALFGSSKLVVMGPEATSAILTVTAVAPLAGDDPGGRPELRCRQHVDLYPGGLNPLAVGPAANSETIGCTRPGAR